MVAHVRREVNSRELEIITDFASYMRKPEDREEFIKNTLWIIRKNL
jgi:hypothetical protein